MGKTVLITGTSSGIGRATVLYFSERGWNVVATMRNPGLRNTDFEGRKNIDVVALDVLNISSIRAAIDHAVTKYGGIDVLVNNAGYATFGPFEASTPDIVRRQFHTNVEGLMDVTREILPLFRAQKQGTIVNVTSAAGRMTYPLYSIYNSSKWAVEGFSEALLFELRPLNIKVKIIEPGIIHTDFYERSKDLMKKEGLVDYDQLVETMMRFEGGLMKRKWYSPPVVAAKAIYQASTDDSWKLRYHTGRFSGAILALRRILPERVFLGMLRFLTLRFFK
jgi:NAD(P)-dependent dehydrogenase (short-subunit alcohol dehydrogenase family)